MVVRLLPSAVRGGITDTGTPDRPATEWKRNPVNPASELPAQTPVPTHRYKPREVRRQGYSRESRSPSRRVVVKLGSWSACADGVPPRWGAVFMSGPSAARPAPLDQPVRSLRRRPSAGSNHLSQGAPAEPTISSRGVAGGRVGADFGTTDCWLSGRRGGPRDVLESTSEWLASS